MKSSDIDGFADWLGEAGLSPATIEVYVRDVTKGLSEGGLVGRLRSDDRAPKTRRHMLAASRRWADFTEDVKLAKALREIRLPPPRRRVAKVPLTREQMFELVDEIDRAPYLDATMRGVLGMMACRGLRCGDVLRLRRREVAAAKTTGTLAFEAKGSRRVEFKVLRTYRRHLVALADAPGAWERVEDVIAPYAAATSRRRSAAKAVERALTQCGTRLAIWGLHPHRLRRTYAVEYLRGLAGDPEAIIKLMQHMSWSSMMTAMDYVDHARGDELDEVAERVFQR